MNKQDTASIILKLSQDKFRIKQKRIKKVEEARKLRKEIYNFSMEINNIEKEIDRLIMEYEARR